MKDVYRGVGGQIDGDEALREAEKNMDIYESSDKKRTEGYRLLLAERYLGIAERQGLDIESQRERLNRLKAE